MAIGHAVNHPLMMKIISKTKKIISKTPWWFQDFHWDVMFLVVCVLAVGVDPLFFYLPVINEATKCFTIDATLEIIAICVRSFLDLIAFGNLVASRDYMTGSDYVINILAILPVPQVVVPLMFSKMSGSKFRNTRRILKAVVLIQYVPRIIRIYRLWRKVSETIILPKRIPSTTSTSTVKVVNAEGSYKNMMIPPIGFIVMKAGFNLFLYLVASHILGAFWYLFSIERETTCWHVACEPHQTYIGCSDTSFNCDAGFGNHTSLNETCSLEKNTNATLSFEFGIFQEARQSGTLVSMDFPRKAMFCFWWGLRNLSSLGQNLETSSEFWENCFTVLISVFGLLLFLYFIGNLQVYMQWEASNELKEIFNRTNNKISKRISMSSNGRKRTRDQPGQSSGAAHALETRPILVERPVILSDFSDLSWEGRSIQSIFTERRWIPICEQRGTAYPEMVGEFYRAMKELSADALLYTLSVRGVSINFSPCIIAEFLDIPRVANAYPAAATQGTTAAPSDSDTPASSSTLAPNVDSDGSEDEDLPDDGLTDGQVRQLVRDPSAPPYDGSKVIRQADCIAFFRMLNLIVGYNIDPKKHKTGFGIDRARFLLQIARGDPIDLALYLFLRIQSESRFSSGGSLPFALLISNLLLRSGVTVSATERWSPQMGPLNKITFSKSNGHLRKTAPEQPSDPPTDPASSSVATVERQPPGATLDQVRALFVEFVEPIIEKLRDLEGSIKMLQEDVDLLRTQ